MFSISVLFFALQAVSVAAFSNDAKFYYGREFQQVRLQDGALKAQLFQILAKVHVETAEGFDRVQDTCDSQKCYQHLSLGYDSAREILLGELHLQQQGQRYGVEDFYCEKTLWPEEFPGAKPAPRKVPDPRIVNTEHSWPQSKFSKNQPKEFQKSDLHHLFPVDSEMNSARSSHDFGEVRSPAQSLKCAASKMGYGPQGGSLVFEPPQSIKGNVARAIFYFSIRYQMGLNRDQEESLRLWHRLDPVDETEKSRNEKIFELQRNRNPFIDMPELVDRIADF